MTAEFSLAMLDAAYAIISPQPKEVRYLMLRPAELAVLRAGRRIKELEDAGADRRRIKREWRKALLSAGIEARSAR